MILQNILIHEFCRKVVDIFNSVVITTEFPPLIPVSCTQQVRTPAIPSQRYRQNEEEFFYDQKDHSDR